MNTSLIELKAGMIALAGAVALSLAGCSSSLPPEEEETTVEPTTVSETVTEASSEDEDAASETDQQGTVPELSDYQMEGSPAEWKSVAVGGEQVDALVPMAESSAGGSIIWKGTADLTSISFKAGTPDSTDLNSPLVVKVITADNQRPTIVKIQPGTQETVSADLSKSDIVKIVWSVEGQPAEGNNVAFYDFQVQK